MPTVTLSPVFRQQFFGNNGIPLNGGKLFSYLATTTTKTPTYADTLGVTPNANPVILDFRGEANVNIEPNKGYKFVLAPANDTDPPTNPIWSLDNVKSSQLITLYGGVDAGVANAYVLTFTANFTAYTDGIIIYWIPATTNSGASTINVNGLGPVSILNQNGTPLAASQLVAGQVASIMFSSGAFLLLSSGIAPSLLSGSFVPTWTGFGGTPPTCTARYTKIGNTVTLQFDPIGTTGVSTATGLAITNIPAIIRPQTAPEPRGICMVTDNGAQAVGAFSFGVAAGTMKFWKGTAPPNDVGFTAAGNKGFSPYQTMSWSTI